MSDSILNETIQTVQPNAQEKQSKQPAYAEGNAVTGNHLSYFRHKGIKVKFEDIEHALLGCELVSQAVVISGEDKEGNRKLLAYIIPLGTFNQMEIANYLVDKLPPYMIPAIWICVEKFPLTPDGKIDKNALHKPVTNESLKEEYIAPRNDTEAKLVAIIQNLLGVQSISINDNFFRLGGGSLQALRVISAIGRELELELDIKYFFLYPTIAGLAAYLQKLSGIDPASSALRSSFDHYSSIIPIKYGGGKMPLYIVCGGGGTAFTFEKFACLLDDDQPVYGFQQPSDINELQKFPDTIETIAAKYVEEILLMDPDGPYALSGHCIGGVIALEMARMLELMGKQIKLLAMFDVILSRNEKQEPATFRQLYQLPSKLKKAASKAYLKVNFETFLLTKHPKDAIEYKINNLKSFVNKFYRFQKEEIGLMVFKQFEQKFEKAFEEYQVNKYNGDILVFYARDHYHFLDKNRNIRFKKFLLEEEIKNIWNDYARSVKIYEIEGEHSTIFEPFYSKDFAILLQQHLNVCKEK